MNYSCRISEKFDIIVIRILLIVEVIMKAIIGLGNPGKEYEQTRHNVGFEMIRALEREYNLSFSQKFKGLFAQTTIEDEKVLFLMPMTYMNLSGESILEMVHFYKLNPKEDMIIIYDDMDLSVGKLRVRARGSSAGHNGIKSIISHFGQEFIRIKVGIGKSKFSRDSLNHVLGKFDEEEKIAIIKAYPRVKDFLTGYIKGENLEHLMGKIGG